MVNAFQQGQQFAQQQQRRKLDIDVIERRERGINALGDKFGPTALAPAEAAALENSQRQSKALVAREQQRGINNKRTAAQDAIKADERADRDKTLATQRLIGFFEAGIKGGATPQEIVKRATPALQALGVDPQDIGNLPQQIADNPKLIEEFKGAFASQQAAKGGPRVVGQPVPIRRSDGSTALMQQFSDGSTKVISDATPLSADLAQQRIDVAEEGLEIKKGTLDARITEGDRKVLKDVGAELKEVNQARTFNETTVAAAGTVNRDIQSILEIANTAAGFGGDSFSEAVTRAVGAKVLGTEPFEVQKLIDSVKSNVGIDSLLRIKQSGAGLGQVPQSQLETLQSLLGNLSVSRKPELLLRDLNDINTRYNGIVADSQKSIDKLDKRELKLLRRRDTIEQRAFGDDTAAGQQSIEDLMNKYAPVEGQ